MTANVVVKDSSSYESYISQVAPTTLGKQEWTGACATCHGMTGKGGYGPDISTSPLLVSQASLIGILRNGLDTSRAGAMPPVGKWWTMTQIRALSDYAKTHISTPGAAGATNGG
jgi:mono/diheme cytochrome c family protein